MSGWGDLGSILSGGVARDAEAQYLPQLAKNFSAFKALEEAKIARSQVLARDSLRESGKAAGASPFAIDTMLSNSTVDFRNAGDAGNPHYFEAQNAAYQAAQAGELGVMNNMLGYIDQKPMERSKIQEGVMFDPYSGKQEGIVTPVGDSMIAENLGSAMSSQASAGKYNADTRKTDKESKILDYDLGAVSRGEPVPSKRTDNKGDTDSIKSDESAVIKSARAALNKTLSIKDPVKRKATQQAIYTRLSEAGYGKIANDLMGE
jgi:hypothetical protein